MEVNPPTVIHWNEHQNQSPLKQNEAQPCSFQHFKTRVKLLIC